MQQCWLQQRGARDCLVFCAGFGMDAEPFRLVPCRYHDLLMLWDWRTMAPFDPAPLLERYRHVRLLAWSMGVLAAARLLGEKMTRLHQTAALNGTLQPIDERGGIPPDRYQETLRHLNESTLADFYRSMFDEETAAAAFLAHRPRRDIEDLRDELAALWQLAREEKSPPDGYQVVAAGLRDRVMPVRSQLRAWGRERCRLLPLPHFFLRQRGAAGAGWPDWDNLVRDLFGQDDDGAA